MPKKEWNTIVQYHQALTEALDPAIHLAIFDLDEGNEFCNVEDNDDEDNNEEDNDDDDNDDEDNDDADDEDEDADDE
jgi:hypothetical protein